MVSRGALLLKATGVMIRGAIIFKICDLSSLNEEEAEWPLKVTIDGETTSARGRSRIIDDAHKGGWLLRSG